LINFVDATNDANHYTKPPPAATKLTAVSARFKVSKQISKELEYSDCHRHWITVMLVYLYVCVYV